MNRRASGAGGTRAKANAKSKPRILIVEDEPQLRALLRLYLEREGYAVADVGDGAAALAAW